MKTLVLNVFDDSKLHLLIGLLRELRFVEIQDQASLPVKTKKFGKLPASVRHSVTAESFRMFSRDELHDR
uniref:Uncharacterized protein n=1 Tax=Candidatus Kentrum sp. DK TaxID=2126562 RepID=A0A450SM12_9GAMM|nr:MAG: hypothetical protein BECKDK2373B_GA0170837_104818 [Candidatus Kentron sp. DK]